MTPWSRADYLGRLQAVNAALADHGAKPDTTVEEAELLGLSARDLRIIIEQSTHRLASLIAIGQ